MHSVTQGFGMTRPRTAPPGSLARGVLLGVAALKLEVLHTTGQMLTDADARRMLLRVVSEWARGAEGGAL